MELSDGYLVSRLITVRIDDGGVRKRVLARIDNVEHEAFRRIQGEFFGLGNDILGNDTSKKAFVRKNAPAAGSKDREMGSALRSVYQQTVEEAVPDEMLALLSKLG